jgi:N-acetyl-anhydromuramyl-L-alanine amidase AmpD
LTGDLLLLVPIRSGLTVRRFTPVAVILLALCTLPACTPASRPALSDSGSAPAVTAEGYHPYAAPRQRQDDLIVVAGRYYHIGTRVVLWNQPGGLNGYAVGAYEHRTDSAGRVIGNDLPALQQCVDQLVFHYDGSGASRRCFRTLQERHLSVQFLLDLDGTVYQDLDAKEKAWHATSANGRSVGVEIANAGAVPLGYPDLISRWYRRDQNGHLFLASPATPGVPGSAGLAAEGLATRGFVGRPARDQAVTGLIQGVPQRQYDFTREQYEALAHLTAGLCRILPQIRCDYPRDAAGRLPTYKLSDKYLARYTGLLGHYHIQSNKIDPGPAFQWDLLVTRARELMYAGE